MITTLILSLFLAIQLLAIPSAISLIGKERGALTKERAGACVLIHLVLAGLLVLALAVK